MTEFTTEQKMYLYEVFGRDVDNYMPLHIHDTEAQELDCKKKLDTFGERLNIARTRKGMPKGDLAIVSGIPTKFIEMYENGDDYPNLANLIKLADRLKVSIDWLLGRDNFGVLTSEYNEVKEKLIKLENTFEELNRFIDTHMKGDFVNG